MSMESAPADPVFRSAMGVDPPTPEYRDPASAAFRMENPIVNIAKRTFEDTYPAEPDHNPLGIIANTPYEERHLDRFLGSTSENMTRSIMARIDQEEQDRRTLDAAGFGGVMLQMLAGVLDPTIALPAGTIYRTGRAGYSLTRSGASVGGATALQAGVSESVLQAAQETRTLGESATVIASATLLGALIGGGASRLLTPAERWAGIGAINHARVAHDLHAQGRPIPEGFDVFHGSPHDFDKFDLGRIGTGEGAQAYGHGLYFAEKESTARFYLDELALATVGTEHADFANPLHTASQLIAKHGSRARAVASLKETMAEFGADDFRKSVLATLESDAQIPEFKTGGGMYRVRVLADKEHFLDWDKPIAEQSEFVQNAIRSMPKYENWKDLIENAASLGPKLKKGLLPGSFTPEGGAKALRDAGIPGIKYLDQGSRRALSKEEIARKIEAAQADIEYLDKTLADTSLSDVVEELERLQNTPDIESASRNFVVFDDNLLAVTHKNGQSILAEPEAPAPFARSVGAAAADTRELSPVPYGLDKIPVVGKLFSKLFPTLNALQNGDLSTRRIVSELATFPGRVKDNLTGGTTTLHGGPAIDLEVNMIRNGTTARMGDELLGLWAEHRFGSADVSMPSVRAALSQVTGDVPAGKLSWDDFDNAVYDALSQGDKHEIPQVAAAAQWIRREVLDPLSARAEAGIEGFEKITPREGESYAPRMWNHELIRARWNDFVTTWTDRLAAEQTVKAAAQKRIAALNEKLQSLAAKLEGGSTGIRGFRGTVDDDLGLDLTVPPARGHDTPAEKGAIFFATKRGLAETYAHGPTGPGKVHEAEIDPGKSRTFDVNEMLTGQDAEVFLSEMRKAHYTNATRNEYLRKRAETPEGQKLIEESWGRYVKQLFEDIERQPGSVPFSSNITGAIVSIGKREGLDTAIIRNMREGGGDLTPGDQIAVFNTKKVKAASEDEAVAARLRHDELRAKIEEEIAAWEGKSTREAKAAIKAREKYAADAARETDAPRLRQADKAVDDTVKKIIESKRDLSRDELRGRAEEIASRHIGTPEGRLPYDVDMGGPQIGVPKPGAELRGHLAKREVDLPYQVAAPWLDKSATRSIRSYLHSVLPDTIIAERMSGDPNMLAAFKEIESSYAARLAGAKSEKESKALLTQRDTDMKIVAGIRDRIRGTFGFDPDMKYTGRVSQAALRVNNIVSSHMMAVSSLPDFAGAIFRHGLESAFSDGWRPFAKAMMDNEAWEAWKKHGQEWRAFGIGVETKIAARQHAIDDINELHRPASRGERALAWASDKAFIVNLLSLETDLQKRVLANVSSHNILRAARAVAEGKASKKQIALLGESNIKPHVAERIWQEFQGAGGDNIDGVLLPNLAEWKSQEAKLAFTGAVVRDVEIGVVTPGQEKPLWMSKPGWNVLGQYKAFTASATMRILVANLQRSDAAALQGLIASVGMGMLAYRINTMASGQPTSDRVQDWVKEGISRSGVLGWLDDGNTFMAKATRGGVDAYRLIGADKPLSRYVSRSASDIFLGPTYGKLQNAMRVGGALGSKEWTEGDTHALRMSLLGSNLPYLPRLFEQVEKGFNGAFGIEMKAKP